jgi:SAM-dependent methyltransferase
MGEAEDVGAAYGTLFAGLDQLGPTTDATRTAVLELIRDRLPVAPAIADLGCGSGVGSLFLARALPAATVTAVDLHAAFLAELRRKAAVEGAAITVLEADMASPPLAAGSLDLVWCDSAIYNIGREPALDAWRELLKPAGLIAFSDVTWAIEDPPAPAAAFWAGEYPAMTTIAGVERDIEAADFALVATHRSPGTDWQTYYAPLRQRLSTLRPEATATLDKVLDAMAREIVIFDRHGDSYASVFFIVRPSARGDQ